MRWAFVLLMVGCHAADDATHVTIPQSSASASASVVPVSILATPHLDAPLAINASLVSPDDGHIMATLPKVPLYTFATHAGPHKYRVGDTIVDTWTGEQQANVRLAALEGDALIRREPSGRIRWKIVLRGVHSVRPSDAVVAQGRVIAVADDKLYAFDDVTGARVWEAPLPPEFDAFVVLDPQRIALVGRESFVLDHAGTKLFDLHEAVLGGHTHDYAMHPAGHDLIVATTKHLTRFDAAGAARWQLPALHETFVVGTDFVDLDSGDVVIANWGAISDSGVWVTRVRATAGTIVWEVHVPGLGVGHSEYMHGAYIEIRGDEVYVVSQAVGGAFFERLSLTTGKSKFRHVMSPSQ